MTNPVVLFRGDIDMEGELDTARKHLPTVEYRSQVPPNSSVIARYSVLPYYQELERELVLNGSRLLNSYAQHKWIADLMDWGGSHGVLSQAGLTPMSWPNWARLKEGAYVVKGRTNSRKQQWATHMFAPTLADIPIIAARLLDDQLLQDQGLVVRQYVPLRKLAEGLNGLPVTNEWRTFWLKTPNGPELLASGYYWQASHPEADVLAEFAYEGEQLARQAAEIVMEYANFFVLDVAEKEDGGWMVVEVNDGQMSGLCGCEADDLYSNLTRCLGV
jgi:hypothetical protein